VKKNKITDAIKNGKILVSDGAWGTFLYKKGLKSGECAELWCLTHANDVMDIAKSYVESGADMIETNSFGGTSFMIERYGLKEKVAEINEASARISRSAMGDNGWVIASIGPSGKMFIVGEVTEDELYSSFKEQAIALEKGGADAICIETMADAGEAEIAIKAVLENTNCEVICTFTFDHTKQDTYRTMMGLSPTDAAKRAIDAGANIIGTNCGNGAKQMIDIVREMRSICQDIPILVHANAGLPRNINGVDVFPESPEDMAALVPELVKAGANIIGGCCGTTPAHIKAIKEAIIKLG